MAAFADRIQALMDEVYTEAQKEENQGKDKWDILGGFSEAHQIAVVFGNFNYQVENGGLEQWVYNGYFHEDAEKLIEHLEAGAQFDARCKTILEKVFALDSRANETGCDSRGFYRDPENEDGETDFIGDDIDCESFDNWYYEHCGEENWWETVCDLIEKAEAREASTVRQALPAMEAESADTLTGEKTARPPLRVYIENARDTRIGGFTMPLPAKPEALRPFLDGAEIHSWRDMKIVRIHSDIKGLEEMITDMAADRPSAYALNELNYLAAKISGLNDNDREIFAAVVESGRRCGNIAELINVAENAAHFDIQPALNAEMYGEFLLDTFKDNTSGAYERLEKSDDPEDRELAAHIRRLEASASFRAFGRAMVEEENGVFTQQGYLREVGAEFKTVYHSPRDIPADYQVMDTADHPLMAADTDLTAFVLKTHALGGDFMPDAWFNLNALEDRRSAEYLMLITDRVITLTAAADAYREGAAAYDAFTGAAGTAGVKAFALHVTDVHQEHVIGNIVTLDAAALKADIQNNSIQFSDVTATAKIAPDMPVVFSRDEWNSMGPLSRDKLQSWTRHFDPDDLASIHKHLEEIREAHADSGRSVDANTLLAGLNKGYMSKAEHPQPDMLRVTLPVAKEMLTHGDAEVYRLMNDGPKELSPLDAMKSRGALQYQLYREFAVYRNGLDGLDKWAAREAKALAAERVREPEAPEKPKSRGPEL